MARKISQKVKSYKFPVVIEKDEDGYYVADCPILQGCHAQGDTIEEAITNIREVIELCLEEIKEQGREIPSSEAVGLTTIGLLKSIIKNDFEITEENFVKLLKK